MKPRSLLPTERERIEQPRQERSLPMAPHSSFLRRLARQIWQRRAPDLIETENETRKPRSLPPTEKESSEQPPQERSLQRVPRNSFLRSLTRQILPRKVPVLLQMSSVECGAACLAMILSYY